MKLRLSLLRAALYVLLTSCVVLVPTVYWLADELTRQDEAQARSRLVVLCNVEDTLCTVVPRRASSGQFSRLFPGH